MKLASSLAVLLVAALAVESNGSVASATRGLLQAGAPMPEAGASCKKWGPEKINCVIGDYRFDCEYDGRGKNVEVECQVKEVDEGPIDKSADLNLKFKCPTAAGKVQCALSTLQSLPAAIQNQGSSILGRWPAGPGSK